MYLQQLIQSHFAGVFFGAGWISDAMVKTAQLNSTQQFVAIASRTPGKAEAFAQKWNLDSFHNSYEELAAREDIDAIYIGTLPSDRLEVALVCYQRWQACSHRKAHHYGLRRS